MCYRAPGMGRSRRFTVNLPNYYQRGVYRFSWLLSKQVGLVLSFKLKHFGDLGVRSNIKMSSYQYKNSHAKDKTVSWPSYLKHGNLHTWERRSLYWDRVQAIFSPQFNPVNIIMDLCPILQMCSKHLFWAPRNWHKMELMAFRFRVTALYFGIELSLPLFLFIQNQSFVRVYLRPKIALFWTSGGHRPTLLLFNLAVYFKISGKNKHKVYHDELFSGWLVVSYETH